MADMAALQKLDQALTSLCETSIAFHGQIDRVKPYFLEGFPDAVRFEALVCMEVSHQEILGKLMDNQSSLALEIENLQEATRETSTEASRLREVKQSLEVATDEARALLEDLKSERVQVEEEREALQSRSEKIEEQERDLARKTAVVEVAEEEAANLKSQSELKLVTLESALGKLQGVDSEHCRLLKEEARREREAADEAAKHMQARLADAEHKVSVEHLQKVNDLTYLVHAARGKSIRLLEDSLKSQKEVVEYSKKLCEAKALYDTDVKRLEQERDDIRNSSANEFKKLSEELEKKYAEAYEKKITQLEVKYGRCKPLDAQVERLEQSNAVLMGTVEENRHLARISEQLESEKTRYASQFEKSELAEVEYRSKKAECAEMQEELVARKGLIESKLEIWRFEDEQKRLTLDKREAIVTLREQDARSMSPRIRGIEAQLSELVPGLKRSLDAVADKPRKRTTHDRETATSGEMAGPVHFEASPILGFAYCETQAGSDDEQTITTLPERERETSATVTFTEALPLFILPDYWGQLQRDAFEAKLREKWGKHTFERLCEVFTVISKGSKRSSNSSDRICLFTHGDKTRSAMIPAGKRILRNNCPMHKNSRDLIDLCLIIKLADDGVHRWEVSDRLWDEAEAQEMSVSTSSVSARSKRN